MTRWWRRLSRVRQARSSITSIYLGGGTPSLLSSAFMEQMLDAIRKQWDLERPCEISMEANPESISLEKLKRYRAAGVNRLSLGVQALSDQRLRFLRRSHTVERARRAVDHARSAGFDNLSLDLIFATPGQTVESWLEELFRVVTSFQPEHLSCYALTIEPGTPLFDQKIALPDEDVERALFLQTRSFLMEQGWSAYEISNFARSVHPVRAGSAGADSNYLCRHNLNGWRFGDYIGLGAGAHGKWESSDGIVTRVENRSDLVDPTFWVPHETRLTRRVAAFEALLMGLRTCEGMQRATYHRLTGSDILTHHHATIEKLSRFDLLRSTPEALFLTEKGVPIANEIIAAFLNYDEEIEQIEQIE